MSSYASVLRVLNRNAEAQQMESQARAILSRQTAR
jgi:hypothetical protein